MADLGRGADLDGTEVEGEDLSEDLSEEGDRSAQLPDERPLTLGREREIKILLAERDSAARPPHLEVRVPRHLSASAVVSFADDPTGVRS